MPALPGKTPKDHIVRLKKLHRAIQSCLRRRISARDFHGQHNHGTVVACRFGGYMAHWEHREEAKWKDFEFNQPYARGLKRLKEDVLAKTDFDPATLWQWGTMQAMALIEMLRENERTFGEEGQKAAYRALLKTGYDVGRQILEGTTIPDDMTDAEFTSFYATVINRIAYASLEDPKIDDEGQASFHILWCPHQDHYEAFDCRVQRYFVQGMIDAAQDHGKRFGFQVRFDHTIPAGAETCHFTMWQASDEEREQWALLTEKLERKALRVVREE